MTSPYLAAVLLLSYVPICLCSWGDSSPEYRSCLDLCYRRNCSHPSDLSIWRQTQPLSDYFVGWSCTDDCGYMCMWKAVDILDNKYNRIPQFHGRWPFLRLFGLQEPASVLFSLMNLLSHLFMINWFKNVVPSSAPMYSVWMVYALIAMNAWIWSSIFHTRDTPMTEMLDYFCAFSTVLFSLLAFLWRILINVPDILPKIFLGCGFLVFYVHHVYSMATVRFDYGYNMKVNVVVGGLNCICWLIWFLLNRDQGNHIRQGITAVLALTFSVTLELLEFTPIFWSIDSHALWHLVTSPLPLLWYKFAAGDCLVLLNQSSKKSFRKEI